MLTTKIKLIAMVLAGICLCACQPATPDTKTSANVTTNSANTANAGATKVDSKAADEARETIAAHDKALNDQNLDAILATFSKDPKVVLLGTGEGERFVGPEAIKAAYGEIVKDYDKGTLETTCDWKTGGVDDSGKMGWVAATCQAKDSKGGVKREYVLNVTGALVKEDAGWRFISLHMSNSTAPGPPPDAKK